MPLLAGEYDGGGAWVARGEPVRLIDALDVASLERFQLELVEAGFEPADAAQRSWVGPIAESLRGLTEAETMKIVFYDGWPFQHPRLFVEGLDERHVSARGEVCLWATGAPPEEWQSFSDFRARIDEWAGHAATEFRPEDFALDAHLSFGSVRPGTIATVDLESLRLSRAGGGRDEILGTWKQDGRVLEIKRGRKGEIEGRWYFVGKVKVPPRSLDGVRAGKHGPTTSPWPSAARRPATRSSRPDRRLPRLVQQRRVDGVPGHGDRAPRRQRRRARRRPVRDRSH